MIGVEINAEQLRRRALQLGATDDIVRKAMRSAVGKMQRYTRGRSAKGLADALKIKRSIVRKRIRLRTYRVTRDGVEAPIWYGTNAVRLIDLNAKKAKGGVRAMANRFVPGAFIARAPDGNYHVFRRKTKARTPLERVTAPVNSEAEKYLQGMVDAADYSRRFLDLFEHEIEWRTRKLK